MVRVAPWNIPLERRIQTFSVWLFLSSLWISFALIFICFTSQYLFYPFLLYIAWIFLVDKSHESGGRPLSWIRGNKLWTYYFKGFFPINLIRTAELDPSKKYLFGYHPHGVLSFGAFGNFAAQGKSDFQQLFPGIDLRLLTLDTNFKIPFHREFLLSMGCASVSRKSCDNILKSGKSIMIVIGGASEALDAHPHTYDLTLLRRKGFVKVAIQNGACLVPVFSFGENDLYEQIPNPRGSTIRKIQNTLQDYFGFSLPFIKGRGIFLYDYGILPNRKMIITVVGKPIEVKQNQNPSEDDVNKLHEEYLKGLQDIFDQYKDIFAQKRKKSMAFVQ